MSNNLIGIVGLPDVRDALQELGVEVISGDTFPEASRNIREAAKSPTLPVLIEDHKQLGLPQLLSRIEESSTVAIVRRDEAVLEDRWASVPIASSLGDYLRAASFDPIDPLLDDIYVGDDGALVDGAPIPAQTSENATQDESSDSSPVETSPSSAGDWLSDEDEEDSTPPVASETSAPSPETSTAETSLSDWLSDEDEEDAEPSSTDSPSPPPARPAADEDDEEDFDGLFAPRAPQTPAPEVPPASVQPAPADSSSDQHPASPEPEPAATGRRRAAATPQTTTGVDAPRSRRRVALPKFPDPELDLSPADEGSSADALDDELFTGIPGETTKIDEDEEGDFDIDDALETLGAPVSRSAHRLHAPLGQVIVSIAGKGGLGKSTLALCLSQAAAEVGGLSVCLIDANRGQGDLGVYLKVRKSDLPSIYDAVLIGDLPSAILSPEQIAAARSGTGDRIAFSFVQAPRPTHDENLTAQQVAAVRPEHYAQLIKIARRQFDLVVIDTQITEARDTSGVIDNVIGPILSGDGWALGITEFTTVGVENLLTAMTTLRGLGADPARMMSAANKVSPSIGDYGKLPQLLGRVSKWKGAVHYDERIFDDIQSRHIPHTVPTMSAVVMDVLYSVTGIAEFNVRTSAAPEKSTAPFWKRLFLR